MVPDQHLLGFHMPYLCYCMISFSNFRHFRLIDCVLMIYSIYIGDPALSSSSFEAPSTRYTYRYGYVSWRQEKGSSFGDEHVVEATQNNLRWCVCMCSRACHSVCVCVSASSQRHFSYDWPTLCPPELKLLAPESRSERERERERARARARRHQTLPAAPPAATT